MTGRVGKGGGEKKRRSMMRRWSGFP